MKFEKAKEEHIDEIMIIYDKAREYMRANGNYIQWQNGYPSRDIILTDIRNEHCCIYVREGKIAAVFSLNYNGEPRFASLSEGKWLNDEPYVTLKRIAVAEDMHHKNIAPKCFEYAIKEACKKRVRNIKLMTHKDNIAMLKAMEKFGFKYCGIIDLDDGHPRIAYQFCEPLCSLCYF